MARICQAFGVTLQPDTKPPGTWLHAPDTAGSMWVHVVDRNVLDREMSAKSYEDLSCAVFFSSSQKMPEVSHRQRPQNSSMVWLSSAEQDQHFAFDC